MLFTKIGRLSDAKWSVRPMSPALSIGIIPFVV